MKNSYFDKKRLKVNPKLSHKDILTKIKDFLDLKLNNRIYLEIKIIYSFIDISRLNLVRKLISYCNQYSKYTYALPLYEPIRLNDIYVIPRLIKIFFSLIYQKTRINPKDIYVFQV